MLSPVRLSSVTLVRPTQPVEIFCNFSSVFGTLAIHGKFYWEPLRREGVKRKKGSEI